MINFQPMRSGMQSIQELARGLDKSALAAAVDALIANIHERIRDVRDADVVFVPADPIANDEFAADAADVDLAWTLGHVIVHLTASAEEAAFIATELARGAAREGRSRWETPWPTLTTIDSARARLDESRRMILALLSAWPDEPHLETTIAGPSGPRNAIARFLSGLSHAESHLEQITEIARQAQDARGAEIR